MEVREENDNNSEFGDAQVGELPNIYHLPILFTKRNSL